MYLTADLKKYYINAFKETENSQSDFWKIESGILKQLNSINNNDNIQTLYSKCAKNSSNLSIESYLIIAYSRNVELTIFREILPYFMYDYNDYDSTCYYSFNEPKIRKDKDGESGILNLRCVDDPNYFNINHIRIELKEGSLKLHDRFWKDLTEKLSEL